METRNLASATAVVESGELVVIGSDQAERFVVGFSAGKTFVRVDQQTDRQTDQQTLDLDILPPFERIRISAGGGDDTLIVDQTAPPTLPVSLAGDAGNDTLVSLGSASVLVTGGDGTDLFWAGRNALVTDASPADRVNRVNTLRGQTARIPPTGPVQPSSLFSKVADLVDPVLTSAARTYRNFADRPLFGHDGPTGGDVLQGALDTCFLLATLGAVATVSPLLIRATVTDLADGTFAVRLLSGATNRYYRVDADLPVDLTGQLAYARLGQEQSLWVAVVEKAFAISKPGGYRSLATGGWMKPVFSALGVKTTSISKVSDGAALLDRIDRDLTAGQAVTYGTKRRTGLLPVVSNHAYAVEAVVRDDAGRPTGLRLRNPWGWDGPTSNGVITLTPAEAKAAFTGVVSGKV